MNRLAKKFNNKGSSKLEINDSTWYAGSDPEIDRVKWEKGTHQFNWKGYPSIFVINSIIDPEPLPFDKVRGEMMAGYQEQLENDWIRQLKEKYPVKIDSMELNSVKKRISNE